MSKYDIAVYKSECEDGLRKAIASNTSIAYMARIEPENCVPCTLREGLHSAFASTHEEGQFDLYYLKDVLVTTGWNKNRDIFDYIEAWLARHTPEHKPFNFEHRPMDIIGHITASHVVNDEMVEIADDTPIDDLPPKFHIVNGSVIYMQVGDEDRRRLMEQTVEEIKRGEWFVSMECLFRGFDYGVIAPDGSHRIIPRNESTAFLTKHLAQYGGTGSYKSEETGEEFTLGRVLRNITFSGKGLVRKPANPESRILLDADANEKIIFDNVQSFIPTESKDSVYFTSVSSPSGEYEIMETKNMSDVNANEQVLRDQNGKLERQVETLQAEIASLKSKDTEVAIANLRQEVADRRKEVADRDALIQERDKTIAGLQAQIETVTQSVAEVQKRAETAEADRDAVREELKVAKAAETKRAREAILRDKHAPVEVVAGLVEKLAVLDDQAFAETIETISASWAKPKQTKNDPVVTAIQSAKTETEPALATASENQPEVSHAAIVDFMGKSLRTSRGARPSVYANTNGDD